MADLYIAVYYSVPRDDISWPYDWGDDPAFEASEIHCNRITWGVCRTDVRNKIQAGDLVVFFATRRDVPKPEYRFVGWATVGEKIRRDQIWKHRRLAPYRQYNNLLIQPSAGRIWHIEPPHYDSRPHDDWLWRIGDWRGKKTKAEVEEYGRHKWLWPSTIPFATNYVLFRAEGDGTFVLAEPPTVATYNDGDHETWAITPLARSLKNLLFPKHGRDYRDYLRTSNQHRHRHIRIPDSDVPAICRELREFCKRFNLGARSDAQRRTAVTARRAATTAAGRFLSAC